MRILITGHRGNVGAAVTDHLERLGHEVTGFDRVDGAFTVGGNGSAIQAAMFGNHDMGVQFIG